MDKPLKPFFCFGTRPEAIKISPVIREFQRLEEAEPFVCSTGQHREMLDQVLSYFEISVDCDLDVMEPNQQLAGLTAKLIRRIDEVVNTISPDCIVAQGDTTTVMAASLVAFYNHLPFHHIEAGLRTYNANSPWPEEMNRRIASLCGSLHFAPTKQSAFNLRNEGVPEKDILVTGNTVLDSLAWARKRECGNDSLWNKKYEFLGKSRMVLITGHRRESFGQGIRNTLMGIKTLAKKYADTFFIYPVHLNPKVQVATEEILCGVSNIKLLPPASYQEFVWLMDRSHLIITDSGGVQEEGPSFGKPILVTRENSERPEAIAAKAASLVGTDGVKLIQLASSLMDSPDLYKKHTISVNPYGDGRASQRIVKAIIERHHAKKSINNSSEQSTVAA